LAMGLCVMATFVSLLTFGIVTQQGKYPATIARALPTVFWWFGFSASLWICVELRSNTAQRNGTAWVE